MEITFKPQGKYVLVELVQPDAGRLILPVTRGKDAGQTPAIVRVLAVGEGRLVQDGARVPLSAKPGDEVLLRPDALLLQPNSALYGGSDLRLVNDDDIVAVVEGREGDSIPLSPPQIVKGKVN